MARRRTFLIDNPYFNANRLKKKEGTERKYFVDASDGYANLGYVIDFTHVPSGRQIFLKAFILTYNETFNPEWTEESVYGRMDPIYQFKNTTRNITMGIKIPAASESEAFENLAKVQALTQFLYPNYYNVDRAQTIAQSPLLRLGVMNIGRSQKKYSGGTDEHTGDYVIPLTNGEKFEEVLGSSRAAHDGMLGILKSLTINHNLDNPDIGVIERGPEASANRDAVAGGSILPKLIEINFDFAVIHEHPLGWVGRGASSNFAVPAFPYGVDFNASAQKDYNALQTEEATAKATAAEARRSDTAFVTTTREAEEAALHAQTTMEMQISADKPGKAKMIDIPLDFMRANDAADEANVMSRSDKRKARRQRMWEATTEGAHRLVDLNARVQFLGIAREDSFRNVHAQHHKDRHSDDENE